MPRISVCLTHYDRPDKLAATLESLARQTRVPDEVLLWDDCSPRDPTEVVRSFEARFPHFVYHRNERNLGMPGHRN
jgi:glycosyltransferase involved in cell wall biosynthesis